LKQVLQDLQRGVTSVVDVPCPRAAPGHLIIRSVRSLVSAGTERMLVDFGRANIIDKARQQPERVAQAIDKARTDGIAATVKAVREKLDQPLTLGYCNVGRVIEVGAGVTAFAPGDRVASNGKHAEMVAVPVNLCAKVPDAVTDDEAAFAPLAAIALQGIRLAQPTLGETVVVTGLGLVGLLTVQLLRAQGCRVLGLEFDSAKLELARRFGAEVVDLAAGVDPVAAALAFSRHRGVDAVIITAATKSSEPMQRAAQMCRKRGRIVLVGVAGLELNRADFYEKELSFQVSCSYGPGRHDPSYESGGHDYPFGFVRWTEQRNFEAVLDMLADQRIDVKPLISHRIPVERAAEAYDLLVGSEPTLGILLEYADEDERPDPALSQRTVSLARMLPRAEGEVTVSFLGSGNYANGVLMPAFRSAPHVRLRSAASNGGVSGLHAGRKHGFAEATTDMAAVLADRALDAVVIATRHDSHAGYVIEALKAGKHVFVEKPLCLTLDELHSIEAIYRAMPRPLLLMVGFNRRFAPHVRRIKDLLAGERAPKSFIMTVNAGAISREHWTQDSVAGGGRIVGEACHFIDLLRHLVGAPIAGFSRADLDAPSRDTATLQLSFVDGSIGTVHYFANGNRRFPKERLDVFCAGRILQLDNFRTLRGFGWPGFKSMRLWRQDKGQGNCAAAFIEAIRQGGAAPIPFDELVEVSRVALELGAATNNYVG
jgi:predicted dehydrogenase/threonine dehydrogenase-like Zn-dependent dehydrogenase